MAIVPETQEAVFKEINGLLDDQNLSPEYKETLESKFEEYILTTAFSNLFTEYFNKNVIRGSLNSEGEKVLGSGFTSEKTATGAYKITLSTELSTEGILVATPIDFNRAIRNPTKGKKTFTVNTVSLAEVASNTGFNFIIIPA